MKDNKLIPDLEWYDGGDGIEYEIWIDTDTDQLYKVPIEIVRNFKEKELLECKVDRMIIKNK